MNLLGKEITLEGLLLKADILEYKGEIEELFCCYMNILKVDISHLFIIINKFSNTIDKLGFHLNKILSQLEFKLSNEDILFLKAKITFNNGDYKSSFAFLEMIDVIHRKKYHGFYYLRTMSKVHRGGNYNLKDLVLLAKDWIGVKEFFGDYYLYLIARGKKRRATLIYMSYKLFFKHRHDLIERKLLMLKGKTEGVIRTYEHTLAVRGLKKYIQDKFLTNSLLDTISNNKVLILPMWGPGDEMITFSRMSFILNRLILNRNQVTLATEHRFLALYKRTFPGIEVIEINRKHRGPFENKLDENELRDLLPDPSLYYFFDRNGWEQIGNYNFIGVAPLLAERFIPKRMELTLRAEDERVLLWKNYFDKIKEERGKTQVVGISWRSSLLNSRRDYHYTEIVDWESVLKEREDILYVNLQPHCNHDEIEFLSKYAVNLPNIDVFNDFDSLVAIFKCIDLVICPCTATVEIAAASGCRTFFLSNAADTAWRKNKNNDVWFPSMSFIEPENWGDKKSLLNNLAKKISLFK